MLLQLIRKWLRKRLGITLSVTPAYFLEAAKDGVLVAQILYHYNTITRDELQLIEETQDPAVAQESYSNYIGKWLQRLNYELSDDEIIEIVHGTSSAAVSLFYDLYMKLENRAGSISAPKDKGFVVEKVVEEPLSDTFFDLNPLCEPLIKHWDVVNWEKGRLDALMQKYVQSRKEYNEYLEDKKDKKLCSEVQKQKTEDLLPIPKKERTNYTYDELIAQQKRVLAMEPFEPNTEEAKRILTQIKQRKKQRLNKTAFRIEMQHQLLAEMWKKIADMEGDDFDRMICQKIMKQSMHEKEIAEKLLDIRKQKDIMVQNRKIQNEIDQKRRDEEFIKKLFEDSLEDQLEFHQKKMSLLEEHKRLYTEKLKLKALKHEKVCKAVLDDIIDLSLKMIEYKKLYGVEPDTYTKRDWAALFVKEQPIFDMVLPSELNQPRGEDFTQELEEIYRREMQRLDVVDTEVFNDFIHFRNIWKIEDGFDDLITMMELGMNCLGFAVHRLLLKKFPLLVPEKPNLSQEIEISVCTSNMTDLTRLDLLQRLLQLRGIKVIQLSDATDFCIQAYESELKTEIDEPFPEEEYLCEISPRKEKEEKEGKKGKKEKKGKDKKSGKASKDKGPKKGKKDEAQNKVEDVKPILEDKEAQTPRLFPWEKVIFSNKAKLGRIAKQILGQEGVLDDKLLIQMFLEYLLSMPDIKGWVLINYPNNYEQAALLEQALTGKPVPKNYYDKILNRESLMSVEFKAEESKSVCSCPEPEETAHSEEFQENFINEEAENQIVEENSIETEKSEKKSSGITLLDDWNVSSEQRVPELLPTMSDWNVTSEQKVFELLPDLKDLAYFTEEEKIAIQKQKDEACNCVCNAGKKTNQPSVHNVLSQNAPVNPCVFDLSDSMVCRAPPGVSCQEITSNIKPGYECTCLYEDPEQSRDQEVQTSQNRRENETQTNILTVQPEDEDDQLPETAIVEDVYEEMRLSKIVPNPRPLEKEEYNTVLTAYIKLMVKQKSENGDEVPWAVNLEKQNGIEKFYCDQGCYYVIEYEEFTADTIKCLAKTVIGDYTLPLKNSIELFGEKYKEAMLEDEDHKVIKKGKDEKKKDAKKKKHKEKKSETKVKDKGKEQKSVKSPKKAEKSSKKTKEKGKKASITEKITYDDKETQAPTVEEVEEEEFVEPRAGEENWEYINLPIPDNIEISLADFWYNFEEKYKQNFKDLFFHKRILLDEIIPFLAKTRASMSEFIKRPDQKQYYLREFQKTLNQIDLSLRNDPATKSELLLRIEEFEEKLLGISDVKMRESEEERRNFIRQNWLFHQFCELANYVSIAFQFEIDRLVDTLQFLSDYYIALITKSTKEGYEFKKELLPKHLCSEQPNDAFINLFIDVNNDNDEKTEFHNFIEKSKSMALRFVDSMKHLAQQPVLDMKKIFEVKPKEKPAKKEKKAKALELDEDVKENADNILEEWECAINGEFARMNIHLNVIRNEAFNLFNNIISWIKKIFVEIFEDISVRYENELESVHKACELLSESVEQEVIIRPELSFEADQLAEIQVNLFPESEAEDDTEGAFKMTQLEQMVRILFDLAPSGYIMKKIFLLLINDILYQDDEEAETETPKLWRNLPIETLEELLGKLFDDEEYIYWKDFIMCNLMIPLPTNTELMDVRKQFRQYDNELTELVTREEFDTITFWFENKECDAKRLKSLIFRMYQTDENSFNYTAMLLDFCKDKDQILGFVKALELSLGKLICCNDFQGDKFVRDIIKDRLLFQQKLEEHDEVITLAKRAVSLLIDRILNDDDYTQGLELEEIEDLPDKEKDISISSSLSEGKIISEKKFSYKQIGYESHDDAEMCYFLPLELVLIIISTEPAWNSEESPSFKDQIIEIYKECRNDEFNNTVLAHEFLHNEKLRALLATTKKFLAHNPARIVKQILCDDFDTVEEEMEEEVEDSETTEDY